MEIMKEKHSPHPLYLRLKEVLGYRTSKQIADHFDVTEQSVNGWKRTGKIRKDRLESVASLSGVSLGWLLTGEGAKFLANNSEQSAHLKRVSTTASKAINSPMQFKELPVTAVLKNNKLIFSTGAKAMTTPQRFCTEASQLLEIDSDDWAAEGFQKGDVLIVEPINGETPNNRLVVAEVNGQATIRKIELQEDTAYFPALKQGPAFSVLTEQVKLLFVVTATIHPE